MKLLKAVKIMSIMRMFNVTPHDLKLNLKKHLGTYSGLECDQSLSRKLTLKNVIEAYMPCLSSETLPYRRSRGSRRCDDGSRSVINNSA